MVGLLVSNKKKAAGKHQRLYSRHKKSPPDGQTSDYGKTVAEQSSIVNISCTEIIAT